MVYVAICSDVCYTAVMEQFAAAMDERNYDFVADEMVKKLILLFIFEKMEFPLTDATISEIIMANPSWMTYMDYKDALFLLTESKFIYRTAHGSDAFGHDKRAAACCG